MTPIRRVLWELDRPPHGVAWDHPRLPSVALGPAPLRLNSLPVPPTLLDGGTDRAARPAAVLAWLEAGCGEYARRRRQFMSHYLRFVANTIMGPALDDRVARFAGLFAAEDWTCSALRPLPRAWLTAPGGPVMADILFWDGQQALAVILEQHPTGQDYPSDKVAGRNKNLERDPTTVAVSDRPDHALEDRNAAALEASGVACLRLGPQQDLGELLPVSIRDAWRGDALPASPFRRVLSNPCYTNRPND